MHKFGVKLTESSLGGRVLSYIRNGRSDFATTKVRQLSVAMDGTNMGGQRHTLCRYFLPQLNKALWCPPQVRRASH